ncbi:MAG: ring-cleaving dioxygenase [Armatimonadota bacterium]|nr:ring-cleaving dioxygenase [Armatimonadota bacterium]
MTTPTAAKALDGIHHVTAIAKDPQVNVDFYTGVLGLRLVKRTVNQDDPGTYHLFYGDALGHPGTELTFFAWPRGRRGSAGAGQWVAVALAIPPTAVSYWLDRLRALGVDHHAPAQRLDEDVIALSDPEGMPVELVAGPDTGEREPWRPWALGPVPPQFQIRGVHAVTTMAASPDETAAFLADRMGFRLLKDDRRRLRFGTGPGQSGALLDVVLAPARSRGSVAVGSIHHVAWRTPDADTQQRWFAALNASGVPTSPVIDRFWFHSIYFNEPGGALFEIATDGPGFTVDEDAGALGSRLVLAPWLEPQRATIERALPAIHLPTERDTDTEGRPMG